MPLKCALISEYANSCLKIRRKKFSLGNVFFGMDLDKKSLGSPGGEEMGKVYYCVFYFYNRSRIQFFIQP